MTPDEDPAARFRRPQSTADAGTNAPPPAVAPARPQTLGRLLEETLVAPFKLGALFDQLAAEPVPSYWLMLANLLVYWGAMLLLNVVHVVIVRPQALSYPPALIALVGGAALLIVIACGFALAGAVEVAALAAGAPGNFSRSFQLVTLLSALAPVQAAVNWMPSAWPVPLLLGAFACAVGLERLHQAPAARARVVMAALAAASLFAVSVTRDAVERALAPLEAAEQSAEQVHDIAAQVQQLQQASLPAAAAPSANMPPATASGLDLLRAGGLPTSPQQAEQMQRSAAMMLGSATAMLNNPQLARVMTPQQTAMIRQLNGILGQAQGTLQPNGQRPDPKAQALQLQQLLGSLAKLQQSMPVPDLQHATPQQLQQYQQMQQMLKQISAAQSGLGGAPAAAPPPSPAPEAQP